MASQNHRVRLHYFYQHGSTDVNDIIRLNRDNDSYQIQNELIKLSSNAMIFNPDIKDVFCHDQEPLNVDNINYQFDTLKKIPLPLLKSNRSYQKFFNEVQNYRFCFSKVIPFSKYDKILILHSEKNSGEVNKLKSQNFIEAYYWSHALLSLDWYRYAKFDKRLDYKNIINYQNLFNIYCRSWTGSREYRLKFLEMISLANLDQVSKIKFNEIDNNIHFQKLHHQDQSWQPNIKNLNFKYTINNSLPNASATYNFEDYTISAIDVVLETIFESQRIFLTEKILRPIACGKPFILAASPGSLEYLRSYGFKTFSNIFDESYDLIVDPRQRLIAIVNLMNHIANLNNSAKQKIIREAHWIAGYNKKYFFSKKFQNLIYKELETNINFTLDQIENKYSSGKILNKTLDYVSSIQTEQSFIHDRVIQNSPANNISICHLTPAELEEYRKIINQT